MKDTETMHKAPKAQSLLEYAILAVIVMVALIAMQAYMKRGLQGRWKESTDQLGEQYDTSMQGTTVYQITQNTGTAVVVTGATTTRVDTDNTTETKTVSLSVDM